MSKKTLFTGAGTALITPFTEDGVNYEALGEIIEFQIENSVDALIICGTTGEAATMPDREHLGVIEYAVKKTAGRVPVIAGTGSNDTAHTIALSKAAESLGMDGLLVVSPYYNKPTSSGLVAHYEAVAKAVSTPIILYNVPGRTGVDIPVSVYRELSQIPNIAGVKEASADITKITKIIASCDNDLPIWTGNDELITPAMSLGAKGVISVISNLLPAETKTLADAALSGNFTEAAAIQMELQPVVEVLFSESNPIPVKEAMRLIGYDCGSCRLPLTPISLENRKKLEHLIKN